MRGFQCDTAIPKRVNTEDANVVPTISLFAKAAARIAGPAFVVVHVPVAA